MRYTVTISLAWLVNRCSHGTNIIWITNCFLIVSKTFSKRGATYLLLSIWPMVVEFGGHMCQPATISLLTNYHLYSYLYAYISAGFRPHQRSIFVCWIKVDIVSHYLHKCREVSARLLSETFIYRLLPSGLRDQRERGSKKSENSVIGHGWAKQHLWPSLVSLPSGPQSSCASLRSAWDRVSHHANTDQGGPHEPPPFAEEFTDSW